MVIIKMSNKYLEKVAFLKHIGIGAAAGAGISGGLGYLMSTKKSYNYNKKFDYYYRAFSGVIMTPQNVFFPASKIESILSSVKFEGKRIIDQ